MSLEQRCPKEVWDNALRYFKCELNNMRCPYLSRANCQDYKRLTTYKLEHKSWIRIFGIKLRGEK